MINDKSSDRCQYCFKLMYCNEHAARTYRNYKEKKIENLSIGMLLVLFAGISRWIIYGFLKKVWIIILSNATPNFDTASNPPAEAPLTTIKFGCLFVIIFYHAGM